MHMNEINDETIKNEVDNALSGTLKNYDVWEDVVGSRAPFKPMRIISQYGDFNSPLEADLYEVWLYAKGEIDHPYVDIICQSIASIFCLGPSATIQWNEWIKTPIGQVVYDAMVRWWESKGIQVETFDEEE